MNRRNITELTRTPTAGYRLDRPAKLQVVDLRTNRPVWGAVAVKAGQRISFRLPLATEPTSRGPHRMDPAPSHEELTVQGQVVWRNLDNRAVEIHVLE